MVKAIRSDGQFYKLYRRYFRLQPEHRQDSPIVLSDLEVECKDEEEEEEEEQTAEERIQSAKGSVSLDRKEKHQPETRTCNGRVSRHPKRYGWD